MRFALAISHYTEWRVWFEKSWSIYQSYWKDIFEPLPSIEPEVEQSTITNHVTQDYQYWLDVTGKDLKILLEGASYDESSTEQTLQLFFDSVASYLGPAPKPGVLPAWRSFMTDDFSPLEYSWAWEADCPKIRYSFEPIDTHAGTASDPYNRVASLKCINQLQHKFPSTDWTRFHALENAFYKNASSKNTSLIDIPEDLKSQKASMSSIMLAFDIEKAGLPPLVKAYLILAKSEQQNNTRLKVLFDSLAQIHATSSLPALSALESYLRSNETTNPHEIVIAGIDCVASSSAKLKVYTRSQRTSFSSVISTLTLGGQHNQLWTPELIDQLRELWNCVFISKKPQAGTDDDEDETELRSSSHETSGILYYFDINQTNTFPSAKVYLPVKHYGENDEAVALGLLKFLRHSKHHHHQQKHTQAFYDTLHKLTSHKDLKRSLGCQTYISCAIKNGQLSLTSYFSPELYRWSREA